VCSDFHDIDFGAADALAAAYFKRGGQPAISYGIVADGRLVHSAGFGARRLGGAAPDADTVFRIASMSKSFTASAILLLRDSGLLALDDPADKYVPELASWKPVTPDAAKITIRNLLTMSAGFPTDDPWGDRQQGLPAADFAALLAGGVGFNWAPGTRFEYSNLGYAILGRIVSTVSGTDYSEFVRTRLLAPLGMTRTGFAAEEFGGADSGNLAQGYRYGADGWEPVPFDPYGAFAPMGGLFSTVRDLTAWIHAFSSVFSPGGRPLQTPPRTGDSRPPFPPGEGQALPNDHPLCAASRREMQLPQAVTQWRAPERLPGGGPGAPAYYGFGLFVDEDPALGRVVNHSGGYPGFGTNMRWHPATGLGVIALGNGTYAGMSVLSDLVLRSIVPRSAAYQVSLAPAGGPWPETLKAREAVDRLLASSDDTGWDDAAANALFSDNVALDAPYSERRHAIALVRSRIGEFRASGSRPPESDTPAHCRWWLTGERGTVQAQIQLNPERPPRVQSLTIAVPPEPGAALDLVLSAVVAWMNSGERYWPESVRVAPDADVTLLTRRLRMAAAWAGECRPGAFRFGDGAASVAVELDGEHAGIVLTLLVNPVTGELRQADVTLQPLRRRRRRLGPGRGLGPDDSSAHRVHAVIGDGTGEQAGSEIEGAVKGPGRIPRDLAPGGGDAVHDSDEFVAEIACELLHLGGEPDDGTGIVLLGTDDNGGSLVHEPPLDIRGVRLVGHGVAEDPVHEDLQLARDSVPVERRREDERVRVPGPARRGQPRRRGRGTA
jgi:CubicO group peptidase (beta-lactamase class C family)